MAIGDTRIEERTCEYVDRSACRYVMGCGFMRVVLNLFMILVLPKKHVNVRVRIGYTYMSIN